MDEDEKEESIWDRLQNSDEDLPDLEVESGRDAWIEIVAQADGDTNGEWVQAILVHDGKNMVARFKMPDGSEEIMDLTINRTVHVSLTSELDKRN